MAGGSGDEELIGNSTFEYQNRPRRDLGWGLAYALFLAATVIGGIYGVTHRSQEFEHAFNTKYLSDPGNCPYHGRKLLELTDEDPPLDVPDFFKHAAVWLVVSSGASLFLGMAFLLIFKHIPHAMVRLTIQIQIAIPLIMGIMALLSGQVGGGVFMLVLAGLAALCFYLWRNEIELCARLLGVAAVGLNENPALILFVLVSKLVMSLIILPIFGVIFFSYTNGAVVPNGARAGSSVCKDQQGQDVFCCVWQPEPWVGPFMTLASVSMLWTIFLVGQLRVFVLSGTIAQWYFSPPGGRDGTKGTTLRSLRHGLGPSFGTLSFGAAVLTMIEIARNAMEQARNGRNGDNIFMCLLACVLECFYSIIEYLTKFATCMAAISGESFLTAGRNVTDLLTRNFLKSYSVWWFPPLVLQSAAFLLSAAWGVLIFTISYLSWHARPTGNKEAALLGVISFFVAWVVLAFFSAILLDIVDATYLCYALDKDTSSVTKVEVHDVFSQVPVSAPAGAAVSQPDGDVLYGAPSTPPPGPYVPPSHPSSAQSYHEPVSGD